LKPALIHGPKPTPMLWRKTRHSGPAMITLQAARPIKPGRSCIRSPMAGGRGPPTAVRSPMAGGRGPPTAVRSPMAGGRGPPTAVRIKARPLMAGRKPAGRGPPMAGQTDNLSVMAKLTGCQL
jgi:hypothetical protein